MSICVFGGNDVLCRVVESVVCRVEKLLVFDVLDVYE